jgi:TPR repeat protein
MAQTWIKLVSDTTASACGIDSDATDTLVATCLAAAAEGDMEALFDLGVAYSTGSHGAPCDLIEAHKWFNLAAVGGHEEAATCRAEVSDDMTAREIAEAQRRAREWLRMTRTDSQAA